MSKLLADGRCSSAGRMVAASAPARLDVSGGMAAHTGGVVAQCTIGLRATAAAAPRQDGRLWIGVYQADWDRCNQKTVAMRNELPYDEPHTHTGNDASSLWFHLATIVVRQLTRWTNTSTDSEAKDGLSIGIHNAISLEGSAAAAGAVAVAVIQCLCDYYKISCSPLEKAEIASRATTEIGIEQAHTVDAMTTLCSPAEATTCLLRYRCQPSQLLGTIPTPSNIQLIAIALDGDNTTASAIAHRVMVAGSMGMRIIQTVYRDLGLDPNTGGYLGNVSPGLYKRYFRTLLARRMRGRDFIRTYGELAGVHIDPDHLYHIRAAVDHLIGEGEYAENFLQTMEELAPNWNEPLTESARTLTAQRAGRLLLASQHSYRLRLGLSSPIADWVVARLTDAADGGGAYGARVTENGDGRLVVALLPGTARATDHLLEVISEYGREFGSSPRIYRTGGPESAGALLS